MKTTLSPTEVVLGATLVHILFTQLSIRSEVAAQIAEQVLTESVNADLEAVHDRIRRDYQADLDVCASNRDFFEEVPGMDYFEPRPSLISQV